MPELTEGKSACPKRPTLENNAPEVVAGMFAITPPPELWRRIAFWRLWSLRPRPATLKVTWPMMRVVVRKDVDGPVEETATETIPLALSMILTGTANPPPSRASKNGPKETTLTAWSIAGL